MKDPNVLRSLERIYRLETRSFVRFLVQEAEPGILDDGDRRARGLLEAWYRDTQGNRENLERLLVDREIVPNSGVWALEFSQFNYLRYSYLLDPLKARMGALLDEIEREAAHLAAWSEAEFVLRTLLQTERPYLARIDELRTGLPSPPAPGPRRRVSANWW